MQAFCRDIHLETRQKKRGKRRRGRGGCSSDGRVIGEGRGTRLFFSAERRNLQLHFFPIRYEPQFPPFFASLHLLWPCLLKSGVFRVTDSVFLAKKPVSSTPKTPASCTSSYPPLPNHRTPHLPSAWAGGAGLVV